jgi:hypothetical protein
MPICQIFLHAVEKNEEAAETQFVGFRKPGLGHIGEDAVLKALGNSYFG